MLQMDIKAGSQPPRAHLALIIEEHRADDWILDACFSPELNFFNAPLEPTCQAVFVTAHNALIPLSLNRASEPGLPCHATFSISPIGPRSMLCSAHIAWDDQKELLISTGSMFGQVLLWKCEMSARPEEPNENCQGTLVSSFAGHEGSVFGVRLLRIQDPSGVQYRVVASCSDDRTIRLWNASNERLLSGSGPNSSRGIDCGKDISPVESSRKCIAAVTGHMSRIWSIRASPSDVMPNALVSFGEDSTSQIWHLTQGANKDGEPPIKEPQIDLRKGSTLNFHVGKNIWASVVHQIDGHTVLATGGADGRIITYNLSLQPERREWSSDAFNALLEADKRKSQSNRQLVALKPERQLSEDKGGGLERTFKAYCWLNSTTLLSLTSHGHVMVAYLKHPAEQNLAFDEESRGTHEDCPNIPWMLVDQLHELRSFPIVCKVSSGLALLSGAGTTVYLYVEAERTIHPLFKLPRKAVKLFGQPFGRIPPYTAQKYRVLVTCHGLSQTYSVTFKLGDSAGLPVVSEMTEFNLPPSFIVTSSRFVSNGYLILGSRHGDTCIYVVASSHPGRTPEPILVAHQIHGGDTVTDIVELPLSQDCPFTLQFLTTGRDSHFAIHRLIRKSTEPPALQTIHKTSPPFGPNIEGAALDSNTSVLLLWGFRSEDFILWNHTTQQEIMRVRCGSAHRSWAFLPHFADGHANHDVNDHGKTHRDGGDGDGGGGGGGSFAWTRASHCHVLIQTRPAHTVLQPGLHGREIKAMAAALGTAQSHKKDNVLLATGAEDTVVRISRLQRDDGTADGAGGLHCVAALATHTTGVQMLRWSEDGRFLFSAGGKEEFFVWRVRELEAAGVEIGVVEAGKAPAVSADGDLRITGFDVKELRAGDGSGEDEDADAESERGFVLAMAYSDSSVRVSFSIVRKANRND